MNNFIKLRIANTNIKDNKLSWMIINKNSISNIYICENGNLKIFFNNGAWIESAYSYTNTLDELGLSKLY